MSSVSQTQMENLCRTCMGEAYHEKASKRRKNSSLISMFTEPESLKNNENNTIMDLLRLTTPQLSLEANDLLPKTMCSACVDKLLDTHEFQQMCIRVDQRLREAVIKDGSFNYIDDPLSHIPLIDYALKVELDEPVIDDNLDGLHDKVILEICKSDSGDFHEALKNDCQSSDVDNLGDANCSWKLGLNDGPRKEAADSDQFDKIKIFTAEGEQLLKSSAATQEELTFECDICGSRVKTRKSLVRHKRIHLRESIINQCKYCKKVFEKKSSLNNHLKTHKNNYETESNDSECSIIDDVNDLNDWKPITDHLETDCNAIESNKIVDNTDASHTVKHDKIIDNLDIDVSNKMDETNEENRFECDECGSRLKTRKGLGKHKRIHRREPVTNQCKYCERVFEKKSSLQNHIKTHKNDYKSESNDSESGSDVVSDWNDEWETPIGNVFKTTTNALKSDKFSENIQETNHVPADITVIDTETKAAIEEKPFVCNECGARLKTRKSLKRHLRIHSRQRGEIEKPKTHSRYECEHCKKVFPQSSSLKDHLRVHTGEQPYLCSECGKGFKSLSNMKQHFRRHGTDRPYECPECPKRFPCLSDLASHKAVHSTVKTNVCDVCGAAFWKPYLLKKHKMYHTGEKNHKCDYCEMRFVLADQCRRHMRTHTGEKPYKCKYCVRAFAQSNDLIKHLRSHLGDNVYKCYMCPQAFRLQGDLRTHFSTHKNDDDETRLRNSEALKADELRIQMKFGLIQTSQELL